METPSTPNTPNGGSSAAEPKKPLQYSTTGLSGQTQKDFGMTPLRTATTGSDFNPFPHPQRGVTFRSIDEEAKGYEGYPKLATFIGADLPIYRRFATTNARLLLYRQAEITYLEHELSDLEQKYKSNPRLHQSVRDLLSSPPGSEGHHLWQKIQELNDAVEKYSELPLLPMQSQSRCFFFASRSRLPPLAIQTLISRFPAGVERNDLGPSFLTFHSPLILIISHPIFPTPIDSLSFLCRSTTFGPKATL